MVKWLSVGIDQVYISTHAFIGSRLADLTEFTKFPTPNSPLFVHYGMLSPCTMKVLRWIKIVIHMDHALKNI